MSDSHSQFGSERPTSPSVAPSPAPSISPAGSAPQPHHHSGAEGPVAIDCASCDVRGLACGDCVVTVLLGTPPSWLDDEEQRALGVLAESGLIPPLRLVTAGESVVAHSPGPDVKQVSTSARREAYQVRDTG